VVTALSGFDERPAPDAGLAAGAAARRLGVAVTTLRSWHQRYGLGPSGFRPGRHRRYTLADMARLDEMRRLTSAGVPAARAATAALANACGPLIPDEVGRPGGGHTIPVSGAGAPARGLAQAAMRMDSTEMTVILDSSLAAHGVIHTWDRMIRPVLAGLGQPGRPVVAGLGQPGRPVVAGLARPGDPQAHLIGVEHLLSRSISMTLSAVPRPPAAPSPEVLLACADEEQHTLPLEALAAALAERGLTSRMLGARVPLPVLGSVIGRTGPQVVMVWSHRVETAGPSGLDTLLASRPRPVLIAAAGPGWDAQPLPPEVCRPGDLTEAVSLVLSALGRR
jgi:hypothetical protein